MPTLKLTDGIYGSHGDLEATDNYTVRDRSHAGSLLWQDLAQTADSVWSDELMARFENGENIIEKENGAGYFRVEYVTDAPATLGDPGSVNRRY